MAHLPKGSDKNYSEPFIRELMEKYRKALLKLLPKTVRIAESENNKLKLDNTELNAMVRVYAAQLEKAKEVIETIRIINLDFFNKGC